MERAVSSSAALIGLPLRCTLNPIPAPRWPLPQPRPSPRLRVLDSPPHPKSVLPSTAKTYTVARETIQKGHQGPHYVPLLPFLESSTLPSQHTKPRSCPHTPQSYPLSGLAFHTEVLFPKVLIKIKRPPARVPATVGSLGSGVFTSSHKLSSGW